MTYRLVERNMNDKKWNNPRLFYLKSFIKPLPQTCPECGNTLDTTIDEDETICSHCGLVTSASIEYVGLEKIDLPYGRH